MRNLKVALAAACAVVVFGSCTANADDDVRWVSPTGDDTKDGLTEATAWKTPQKAIDFFGTGAGTVRLTAGTFEGANPILNIAGGAVKVIGAGRDLTVIKPDNSVAKSAVSVVKSGAVVSNLTVTGCSGAYAVSLQNGGGIVFCNVVSNTAGGVKFVAAATSSFCRNCSVSFNSNASGPSAVYHNSWGAAYLRNCLFIGNTTTKDKCGTVNADNGGALNVSFCTFVNNVGTATGGIYENANDISVKNCIFKGNRGNADMLTYDYCNNSAKTRITLKSCMSDQGGGTDPVTGDPAFAGPAVGDCHLRLGSACRNAGMATESSDGAVDATDVDYYGQPRVSGSAPDLGCAELQEPTVATCDIDISNAFVHYAENLTFSPRFEQVAAGVEYDCGWTLSTADGTVLTNLFGAEQTAAFDVFGPHTLNLFATNRANSAEVMTATMPLDFGLPLTNYVSAVGGAGVWPYAHPETATTSFPDASAAVYQRGGVVRLLEGTYTGPQPLFTLDKDIRILGSGDGKTILKPDNTKSDYTVKLQYPLAWLGGVTLTGNTKKQAAYLNKNAALQDSIIVSNTAGGVVFDGPCGNYTRMSRCTVAYNSTTSGNGGAGLYAYTWTKPTIDNCLFIGNVASAGPGGAMRLSDVGPIVVKYCTIIGNNASSGGGGVYSTSGPHRLLNCIVKDNTRGTAVKEPSNFSWQTSLAANLVVSNTWNVEEYGANFQTGDIAFRDAPNGDYRLRGKSCCRDAGVDVTGSDAGQTDRDGNPRVLGAAPDIGCYEYDPDAGKSCEIELSVETPHYGQLVSLKPAFENIQPGEVYDCGWDLSTEAGEVVTNFHGSEVTTTFDCCGPHVFHLFATNRENAADVLTSSLKVTFGLPLTNYVSAVGGAGVWPYAHPETATTGFEAAVAAVCVGGVVKLLEGTFTGPQPLLVLTNEVTVLGSGAGKTILKPDNTATAPTVKLNFPLACLGDVTLTGNTKDRAVWIGNNGTLQDSVVVSNMAGGVYVPNNYQGNVRVQRCTIADNTAARGAGIYACSWDPVRVESCLIVGNVATGAQSWDGGGGGLYVDNGSNKSHYYDYCTVIGNRAAYAGGGFMRSTGTHYMRNCIVKDNECGASQSTPNISGASSFVISNTWTAEGYGTNPVSGDVAFKDPSGGDYHLRSVSVCRDAGADLSGGDATKFDRDGKTRFWGDAPDVGCYEFVPGGETTCDITGLTKDETWKGSTLSLSASVTPKTAGSTYTYAWQLIDANGQVVDTSDAPAYSCVVPGYGPYTLKLAVVNTDDPSDRADCTLSNAFVSKPLTNYVVVAAKGVDGAVPPYDSWATASTNLQAAIDSVCVGGTTVVTSGVHKVGDVNVLCDITVEGVCGKVPASLSYKGTKRMIYVNSKGAVLRNLTLRDAIYTGYGSGSSLWIGPSGGTAEGCTFIGNKARASQASIELGGADARLTRCRLVGNTITDGSARIVQMSQGQVDNCLFEANSNMAGRAVFSLTGAKARLVNNTFVDNVATGAVLFAAKPTANAMLNCILANTRRGDGSTGDEWTTSLTAASDLAALAAAVSNCCFSTGTTLGANAVTGDPKFRNAARGDWRLQSSSPCFDAGLATPEMEDMTDFAGNPRLKPEQGSRAHVDIGCLERGWPGGLLLMVR